MLFINTPGTDVQPVLADFGWAAFINGYNAYMRGEDVTTLHTEDERAGWHYAAKPKQVEIVREDAIEDDHTWIARGC